MFDKSAPRVFQPLDPDCLGDHRRGEVEVIVDPDEQAAILADYTQRLAAKGFGPDCATHGLIFESPHLGMARDVVRFPDGSGGTYLRVDGARDQRQAVAILPVLGDRIVLLRHYRHSQRRWMWEIPRGAGHMGNSATEDAQMELSEELGITEPVALEWLGAIHPDTGFVVMHTDLYLARIDAMGQTQTEDGIGSARAFDLADIDRMQLDGEITDSFTVAALSFARLRGALPK